MLVEYGWCVNWKLHFNFAILCYDLHSFKERMLIWLIHNKRMSLYPIVFWPDIAIPSDQCYIHKKKDLSCECIDEYENEVVEVVEVVDTVQCHRFMQAVLFVYDCTGDVLIEGLCGLWSLKQMMYFLCNNGETVLHVPHSQVKNVLLEHMNIISLCQFEYISTILDCCCESPSLVMRFLGLFFSEAKGTTYVPVVFTGWGHDEVGCKLKCHVFFDTSVKVIKVPLSDLKYFSTMWTWQIDE